MSKGAGTGAGVGTATITGVYSGHTGTTTTTVASSGGGAGAVPTFAGGLIRVTADDYANDAALRADMYNDGSRGGNTWDTPALAPTGAYTSGGHDGKGARFSFANYADLITLDTSVKIQGVSCFKERYPGGTTATPMPQTYFTRCAGSITNLTEGWLFQPFLMDGNARPFMTDDPAAYVSGGIGYKHMSFSFDAGGRWEMEWENATDTAVQMGETSAPGGGTADTSTGTWINYSFNSSTSVWTTPEPYGLWIRVKKVPSTDPTYVTPYQLRVTVWSGPLADKTKVVKVYDITWTLNAANRVEFSPPGPGLPAFQNFHVFGDNCNQTRYAGDRYMWRGATIVADPNTDVDPWGILHNGTPVITSISPTSLARGATSQNITVTGTGFDQNMIGATFSNAGVTVNSVTPVSRTQCTVNVSVSAGATPGAGTMLVKHRYENDSNTVAFSVT